MSGKDNKVVAWDTNIFLAWVKDETDKHGNDVLSAIKNMVDAMEDKKLIIVTSIVTLIEVLDFMFDEDEKEEFKKIQNYPQVQFHEVNRSIAEKSHDLRNYYKKKMGKSLSVPDAIQLATAIYLKVKILYTTDEKDKNGSLGLIPLSGTIAGKYQLEIKKPTLITDEHELFNQT